MLLQFIQHRIAIIGNYLLSYISVCNLVRIGPWHEKSWGFLVEDNFHDGLENSAITCANAGAHPRVAGEPVAAPDFFFFFFFFFFVGRHRGGKMRFWGGKNSKHCRNGWFWPFFLLIEGQVEGGRASDWGKMPPIPPLYAATEVNV